MNQYFLKDIASKYYDTMEGIINDLSSKCVGGEEFTFNFVAGSVIIKLK